MYPTEILNLSAKLFFRVSKNLARYRFENNFIWLSK